MGAQAPGVPATAYGEKCLEGRPLSPREWQVLWAIACGSTNRQMAAKLGVSAQTIKHHVTHIMRKLDARSRAHALVLAITTREALEAVPVRGRGTGRYSPRGLPADQLARAVALRGEGYTYAAIAARLARPEHTVRAELRAALGTTPRAARVSPDLAARMVALRREGLSYERIGRATGVSVPTAMAHVRRILGATPDAVPAGGWQTVPFDIRSRRT